MKRPLLLAAILGCCSVLLADRVADRVAGRVTDRERTLGQELPEAVAIPLHSVVDVGSLPASEQRAMAGSFTPVETRPMLARDPDGLRLWKESLAKGRRPAEAMASGMVVDVAAVSSQAFSQAAPLDGPTVFEGLDNDDNAALAGFRVLPPDDNLGVGPGHIFQMVNISGRITDKSGGSPVSFSLRSFFGLTQAGESDPRVIYDAGSGRWLATYLEFPALPFSSSVVLAVSTTSDPTDAFCRYRIGNPESENFLQDYPMIGTSDDKVVISYNGFSLLYLPLGGGYYILNKDDLISCAPAVNMVRVPPSLALDTPQPAQSESAGSDLYLASHSGTGALSLVTVAGVPGVGPVTETTTLLGLHDWFAPPNARQKGSSVLLDTGDARVLSAAWRDGSLWIAGNEQCVPPGDTTTRSCLRVIEVDTASPGVLQEISYGAVGQYDYYPALRTNDAGDLVTVFTRSSASSYAGVRVTRRLAGDPPDVLQPSVGIRAGGGAQTSTSARMGDYSGAAADPDDPSVVWVMGEYIQSTGSANWATFIAQVGAAGPLQEMPDISVSPLSLDFGDVPRGILSPTQVVTVRNLGTGNLTIGKVSIGGANPLQFRKPLLSDRCSNRSVAPGGSCSVAAGFKPSSTGAKSATLTIPSNDSDQPAVVVTLDGNGI